MEAEPLDDVSSGTCPRCNDHLRTVEIQPTNIRECLKCGGMWTGAETFENLCADKEQQSAVLQYVGMRQRASLNASPVSYVPCPVCKQLMNRSNFARISGVIIDLCKQHGVWFDAEELPKIIDFIDNGGLARSREKEKISLQEERGRLRDEQRRLEMMERGSGTAGFRDDAEGAGFGRALSALFDL